MPELRRKRGRERVYDAPRTREAIVNAALAVFAENGFDGTSMDAIAQTSGYNKSLLFQYFGDKLRLYTQVLKRADREMGELMGRVFTPLLEDETLASNADRFRDFLRSTCGAFFDYMVEHPQVMRLFNWEQAEGWQTFTRIASQFEPEDLSRFEALFKMARSSGLLRSDLDIVVMVMLIQQTCWSSHAALPLYQLLLAGKDVSSATALTHVREQIVAFLVAGMMGDLGARNER
jgi:AcrR family transcriptional regulator